MLPAGASIGIHDPGLVDDEERPPDKDQWPEGAERNVVLEENVAPAHLPKKLRYGRAANNGEREIAIARGLGDDPHFVACLHELAPEQSRYSFDASCAREKMMRAKKNFHAVGAVTPAARNR